MDIRKIYHMQQMILEFTNFKPNACGLWGKLATLQNGKKLDQMGTYFESWLSIIFGNNQHNCLMHKIEP